MPVARDRIGATRRFDEYVRPEDAGPDVDGRDPLEVDTHFVVGKKRPFAADDGCSVHLKDGREPEVGSRPAARHERLGWHDASPTPISREIRLNRARVSRNLCGDGG